jgi:hypothetical protein
MQLDVTSLSVYYTFYRTLKEEHILTGCEPGALRIIFGANKEGGTR